LDLNLLEYPATWLTPLTNYLHICFSSPDVSVVIAASKALGHLARKSNTPEFVEFEMKRAFEWIQNGERHVFSAVLMLKELALNIPTRTSFLGLMDSLIDLIWIPLRDIKTNVRETAAEALRAALQLADPRSHVDRSLPWCAKLFDEAQKGLQRSTVEFIHGSMLVIGELLISSPIEFMNVHYKGKADLYSLNVEVVVEDLI